MKWLQSSKIGLALAGTLMFAVVAVAAEDRWTKKADLPTARNLLATCEVNGKVYAIGGAPGPNSSFSAVEEYDPATGTWVRRASLPEALCGPSASAVNGKIYVVGGAPSLFATVSPKVYAYDPATDTWTRKADMPTARALLSASVVNGRIYAIGGATTAMSQPLAVVEEYDPATDTWTRKADMPTARCCHATGQAEGKIYAVGGTVAGLNYPAWTGLSIVEAYDPATDTWTRKADLPAPTFLHSVSVVAEKIYAIGGAPASYTCVSTVYQYDPVTDAWTRKANMPTARWGLSSSPVDGKIYAVGGALVSNVAVSTVEEYDTGLTIPPPDFNGDFVIDIEDLLLLIEHWGQDDPMCDIAPSPFGDGVVDRKDLEVLMSYWGQEIPNPCLIAHWKLDETEGTVALDNAGEHDGTVIGVPAWQPAGGMVGGALEFNGTTFVVADSVLNPSDGSFSVFAWVKGGAAGQVILSQAGGANWLAVAPDGTLRTELKAGGRLGKPLGCAVVVADGAWHRVGLTWDGSSRILYVDGKEVARDTPGSVLSSTGSLSIGVDGVKTAASFWRGLIDDVRIHDRVVKP